MWLGSFQQLRFRVGDINVATPPPRIASNMVATPVGFFARLGFLLISVALRRLPQVGISHYGGGPIHNIFTRKLPIIFRRIMHTNAEENHR